VFNCQCDGLECDLGVIACAAGGVVGWVEASAIYVCSCCDITLVSEANFSLL